MKDSRGETRMMISLQMGSRYLLVKRAGPDSPRKSQLKRKLVWRCSAPSRPVTKRSASWFSFYMTLSSFFQRKKKSSGVYLISRPCLPSEKYQSIKRFKLPILPIRIHPSKQKAMNRHTLPIIDPMTPYIQPFLQIVYQLYLLLCLMVQQQSNTNQTTKRKEIVMRVKVSGQFDGPAARNMRQNYDQFQFLLFKSMYTQTSTIKIKNKGGQSFGSHLNTYQGEPIRKSICQESRHDKHSHRLATETNEKCLSIGSDMKKLIRQFRLPFKSNSPNLKKKNQPQTLNPHKTPHSTSKPQKKRNPVQTKLIPKNNTEAGPVIKKKKTGVEKPDKKIINIVRDQPKLDEVRSKGSTKKKLLQSRSVDKFFKAEKTKGDTFDCTPIKIGEADLQYLSLIGQGTFGKVFRAKLIRTGQVVAVKKVFQDPKYKNREVEIVSMLEGEFTMRVLGTFSTAEQNNQQFLNIVMEYYQCDLYSHIKSSKKPLPNMEIKLLTYQAFRGLLYIHSLGICHRDIKPHNLLLRDGRLVVCDFGSAKILTSQPNLPYICSRCYRAPELIFGATHYTTMIDVWSLGCVILQMLHGVPLFIGESSIDHLIEIIKVMGTPTKTQVIEMNPDYDLNDYKFPKVKKRQWKHIFPKADPLLLDLLSQVMIYSPKERLNAAEALAHQFYDQLREQKVGRQMQKQLGVGLFDFSYGQVRGNEHLLPKLIPSWVKYY